MSPEQAESQVVDGRSDVFSMGCLLYEMLTGKRAFQRESKIRTLSAILSEEPQRMSEIVEGLPAELERVVSRCLRKERERRFQHMDDLKIALEELKEESESGQLTIRSQTKTRPRSRVRTILPVALVVVALSIAAAVFLRRPKKVRPPLSHPIAVITYRGTEENATLSPDGRQVAFSGNVNDSGNFDLYVKLIGADPLFRLTQNPDPDPHPVWSPDGRWIAFSRYANPNKLLLISPLGGFERNLAEADDITPQTWTPDSKYILAIKGLLNSGKADLIAISSESGQSKRLLKDVGSLATLSHDGHQIVFARGTPLAPHLYIAPVAGQLEIGREREINLVKAAQLGGCTWTVDDTSLVCSLRQKPSIPPSLCRIDPTGTSALEVIPFTEGGWDPVIASSGDRLVYDVAKVERDVWQVNSGLQTRSRSAPVPTRFASWTKSDFVPRYSPDGQKLAFLSLRSGPLEICISSADGSNIRTLAALPDIDGSPPMWAPDGKSLVFVREHELYAVDVRSGAATHVASDAPEKASDPIYSYDGHSIYFASDRTGRSEIWKISVQGGAAVQITKEGGNKPLQSPDGKFFLYVRPGSGKYDVIGLREGSAEHSLLSADGRFGRIPDLAFARGALFYMIFEKPDLPMAINRLDLATGRSSRVNTLTTPQRFSGGDFAASPDGKTFLYWAIDFTDDLMQIENFR